MSKIRFLSESFTNFLGSGEIIQDCSSFVKESIENSMDAESNSVEISLDILNDKIVRIIISDNGTGISRDDLPFLCRRYHTSKLSCYSELNTLSSFGFRGEALNAMSYNANLTVISSTGFFKRRINWL